MKIKYDSFEEIDTRLKILELQRQIGREYVKMEVNSIKNLIMPRNLWRMLENATQGVVISLLIRKFLKRK